MEGVGEAGVRVGDAPSAEVVGRLADASTGRTLLAVGSAAAVEARSVDDADAETVAAGCWGESEDEAGPAAKEAEATGPAAVVLASDGALQKLVRGARDRMAAELTSWVRWRRPK